MPFRAVTRSKSWGNRPETAQSSRRGQFVGLLDIGHDIGRLPQGVGGDRLQGDGPVSLAVRGMLTTSNSMPRHSGCRSSANITRRRISSRVAEVLPKYRSRSIRAPSICRPAGRGGRPSSGAIVGADMVNGALMLVLARARNLSDGGAEQPGMAEAIPQTTTAAAGPSVRAPLAAAVAVSAVTLWGATFELAMADWPSGFVLLAVVPLMALLFFGCIVWSATLLLESGKAARSSPSPS